MKCPTCQKEARKFGKNRDGSQRYQCLACRKTFTSKGPQALGNMRLSAGRAILCLRMLMEGSSIRSGRLTGVNRNTICSLVVTIGTRCKEFLEKTLHHLPVADVQVDEMWGFVGCKEKTRIRKKYGPEFGDAYCFTAIERKTKLLLAGPLGKRSTEDCFLFVEKLRRATIPDFQLTTDGFRPYKTNVPDVFGNRLDFAQLVKVYGKPDGDDRHYSPPQVIDTYCCTVTGNPDANRICTSHVERANKTMRMTVRRLTRLTDAQSKKWENHEAALALFFAWYNFTRIHSTIGKTPAMAAGLTDHPWTFGELLNEMAKSTRC